MYDSYLVVKDTLQNDVVDGKTVGFSFGVRLANYRGLFLSLVNGFYVEVDGEVYGRDEQTFEINGKPARTMDEIAKCYWEHWDMQDMGRVHILKEGGLAPGEHKITYMECNLAYYGYHGKGCDDEIFVKNPPQPGDPKGSEKTPKKNDYILELR